MVLCYLLQTSYSSTVGWAAVIWLASYIWLQTFWEPSTRLYIYNLWIMIEQNCKHFTLQRNPNITDFGNVQHGDSAGKMMGYSLMFVSILCVYPIFMPFSSGYFCLLLQFRWSGVSKLPAGCFHALCFLRLAPGSLRPCSSAVVMENEWFCIISNCLICYCDTVFDWLVLCGSLMLKKHWIILFICKYILFTIAIFMEEVL